MLKLHFDQKEDNHKSIIQQTPIIKNNSTIIANNAIKEDKDSEYNLEDNVSDLKCPSQSRNHLPMKNKEDWFSKKKKSQGGIFILGKKRSTLKLKYRFSIRNKSGRNNSSSLNNQSKSSQDNVEKNYKSDDKGGSNVLVLNSNIYQPKTELMINSTNNKN